MIEPLALKYRPRTFGEVIGQKATRVVLAKMVSQDSLPASLIFGGVRGTGKTSIARIVARAINCIARVQKYEPCGKCNACVVENPLWVVEVDAATYGGADKLRELVDDAQFTAGDRWKVYILDEVHAISAAGFQVLLKVLEEPPPRTTFILVTTEPEKIPDTIGTRSMMFDFTALTIEEINKRIVTVAMAEQIILGDGVSRWLAEQADGGMRDALMLLDQVSRIYDGNVEITLKRLDEIFTSRSPGPWIEALLSGNPAKAIVAAEEMVGVYGGVGALVDAGLVFLRDVLVGKSLGRLLTEEQGRLASRMTGDELMRMIRQLWTLRVEVGKYGISDRAAITALSAELSRHSVVAPEAPSKIEEGAIKAVLSGGSDR